MPMKRWRLAGTDSFDLAILDFNMPGRDGLQLAAELLALKPSLPLAVISANHQVEVVTKAREVGADLPAEAAHGKSHERFPGRCRQAAGDDRRMTTVLTELELDALTEMVNIGVNRAAASLREMVGEQVLLSVPKVTLVSRDRAIAILGENEVSNLVGIHQVFEGEITGRALLIFPDTKSLELVRAVTGGELPLEEIIELEHEALAEIGNIILNGCLATIANMLQRNLKMSLPEILRGEPAIFFNLKPPPDAGDVVMFLYINFAIRQRDIRGYIAMLMDMPSLAALQILLGEFIERMAGGVAPSNDRPEQKRDAAVFDAIDIGLILLDGDRRVVGWNVWMEAASGISSAAAEGRRLDELFPDLSRCGSPTAISHALELGASGLVTHSLHPSIFPLRTHAGESSCTTFPSVRSATGRTSDACCRSSTSPSLRSANASCASARTRVTTPLSAAPRTRS